MSCAPATRAFDVEKGNLLPIMRPTRSRGVSVEVRELFGIKTISLHTPELALRCLSGTGKNCERCRIRRPGGIEIGSFVGDRNFD
jgi:hypothetical protein